jgi:hypothetical protein
MIAAMTMRAILAPVKARKPLGPVPLDPVVDPLAFAAEAAATVGLLHPLSWTLNGCCATKPY